MIKKITYIFIGLLIGTFVTIANAQVRVLTVPQGGTGAATLTGCLQGNGTGAITGTGSACGSGSGSGTAVGWASTTLDINSIYFTGGTTGKVGIGTTTPFSKLQIGAVTGSYTTTLSNLVNIFGAYSSSNTRGTLTLGSTDTAAADVGPLLSFIGESGQSSSPYPFASIKGAKESGGTYNGYLAFFTTPTGSQVNREVMRIDSSGNVGIGTTTPSNKLHIYKGVGGGSMADSSNDPLVVESNLGASINVITPNNVSGALIFSDDTRAVGRVNYDHSQNSLSLWTSSLQRLTINSSGFVGIGSSTPYASLAVTNTGTNPSFIVEDSTSPDTTPFIIDASGNVGIGTTTPETILNVAGGSESIRITDATPSRYVEIAQVDGRMILKADPANGTAASYISTEIDGSEKMRIDSSGNVGIGTTSPNAKLTVSGSSGSAQAVIEDTTATPSIAYVTLKNNIASMRVGQERSAGGGLFTGSSAYASVMGSIGAYPLQLATNGNVRATIDSSGNVGIGSTTPYSKASVAKILSIEGTSAGLILNDSDIANKPWEIYNTGGDLFFYDGTAAVGNRVTIKNGGNVGIGTTSPVTKLHVMDTGAGTFGGLSIQRSDSTTGSEAQLNFTVSTAQPTTANSNGGRISVIRQGAGAQSDMTFALTNTAGVSMPEIMRLQGSTGNVGIGTTPGQKLSVAGDILGNNIIGSYFTATSTSLASVFPYASTTALTATTLCLSTDCRTAWPAGGAGGSGAGFASTTLDINSVYFTGGATGKIGIGTSTPNATLTIATGKSFYSEQSILSTSTSMTVDFDNGQNQLIRTGVSDTTVAFSNGKVGQKVELTVCNPTTTSGALSFTGNVSYRGGISPSHTTTANECDIYVWQVNYATSTAKYFLVDMKSGFK